MKVRMETFHLIVFINIKILIIHMIYILKILI